MDFSGHLADAELVLVRAGFTTELWVPEFGWESAAEEAEMIPEPPQLLAAIQLFNQLYVCHDVRVWAHLAAEMQAGKTGVVTTFIRLVLANKAKLRVRPNRIFILTGMSDDAWKMQTRSRMPALIRENVQHSKGLAKVAVAFERLREMDGSLSNVIVVLDESHIAAAQHNQPYKQIWAKLQELCPLEDWQAKNIRVITISATDPAKVMAISAETRLPCAVVRLQTTEAYQSVETLVRETRVRFTEDFGDLHDPKAIAELKRSINEDFGGMPFFHILRPRVAKQAEVARLLRATFTEATILTWDASSNVARSAGAGEGSSSCDLNDINELLAEAPAVTTFVLLKNMFYAAKTLDDTNVGILYDRIGSKDDTNLQSLLGRACGYGKSEMTVVYTSRQTVENYLTCWRQLCSNPSAPRLQGVPMSRLDRKMTGVTASTAVRGKSSVLSVAPSVRTPLGKADGSVLGAGGGAAAPREEANEDNFTSEWFVFKSFAEAKAFAPRLHDPATENGFFLSSTTGKKTVLRFDDVLVMKGGKKTAHMPWSSLKLGKSVCRLYVGYKDIKDPSTAVFVVRKLTRLA